MKILSGLGQIMEYQKEPLNRDFHSKKISVNS